MADEKTDQEKALALAQRRELDNECDAGVKLQRGMRAFQSNEPKGITWADWLKRTNFLVDEGRRVLDTLIARGDVVAMAGERYSRANP